MIQSRHKPGPRIRHIEHRALQVPIEQAYRIVADPRRDAQWYRGVHAVREIGDGVYEQQLAWGWLRYRSRVRVTHQNPPSRVVLEADSPIQFRAEYELSAPQQGSTVLTMHADVVSIMPSTLFRVLFGILLRKRVRRNFDRLEKLCRHGQIA